jgi:rfaE bifunctional protein kinase chain/domain
MQKGMVRVMVTVSRKKAEKIVSRFPQSTILVIGDVMLDQFIWGVVNRVSPEAPVPVVRIEKESFKLGGAGNVVNNIHSLGGKSILCGLVGMDPFGQRIKEELELRGIGTAGIIEDSGRSTTVKTRIIAHSQQVVRADRESDHPVSKTIEKGILDFFHASLPGVSGVVLSDYAKGILSRRIIKEVVGACTKRKKELFIDPKIRNFFNYAGSFMITPNHHEVGQILRQELRARKTLEEAGRKLLRRLRLEAILITRGEAGMSLFENDGTVTHIPTMAKEVYDVSGAGDTVISTLALSYASGASLLDAAVLSNYAAGIVVGKVGTATVSAEELLASIPA